MTKEVMHDVLDSWTVDEENMLKESWNYLLQLSGDDSKQELNKGLWDFMAADHPDVTIIRFLRAKRWDKKMAMAMLISTIQWRKGQEINGIVQIGENVGLKSCPSADEKDFMMHHRSGKSYIRGIDRDGRPIYIIRARLHNPSSQSTRSMEMFVLHTIENLRIMLKAPNDTSCFIFDLTGFGVRNIDLHIIKFFIDVFESKYPGILGVVLIHNAPFIFWSIWKAIKAWLGPGIASKIHFTNSYNDLIRFISPENLQTYYGGMDSWEYTYIEPVPRMDNRLQPDDSAELNRERSQLIHQFEALTDEWIRLDPGSAATIEIARQRYDLVKRLHQNYWKLDHYTRATTYYHRTGVIGVTGEVDFSAAK
ncbi:uncharacterized protein TrAFT101_008165 [Trichoderma asperellum]|nr:hypothetical protein TrAFT101_008165 [Trichoderma asperellum]